MKNVSHHSIRKQEILKQIVLDHANAQTKHGRYIYTYVDAYAGAGSYIHDELGFEIDGSPVIVGKALKDASIPFDGFAFEQDQANCNKLKRSLVNHGL